MTAEATRDRLLAAAADTLRQNGIVGTSARSIATRGGVNQALIFYHFGSVAELLDAACRRAADQSADSYRDELSGVTSLSQLLELGRRLHDRERANGNVAMMAQLMAGGQQDEQLAATARYAMGRWNLEIEQVVRRVLRDSPLGGLVEPAGLARAISAGFLGLELYEGVDEAGAADALDALESLGALVEVLDGLGPVARKALRSTLAKRPRR